MKTRTSCDFNCVQTNSEMHTEFYRSRSNYPQLQQLQCDGCGGVILPHETKRQFSSCAKTTNLILRTFQIMTLKMSLLITLPFMQNHLHTQQRRLSTHTHTHTQPNSCNFFRKLSKEEQQKKYFFLQFLR